MKKELWYHFLFIINIIALLMFFGQYFLRDNGYSESAQYSFMQIRLGITIPLIFFWIWNIIIWSKKDKKVNRFFALFLLNGFYTLYYYKLVIKNNWLKNEQ